MQRFDYSLDYEMEQRVGTSIEKMTSSQVQKVDEAVKEVLEAAEQERTQEREELFRNAVLPVLKRFAEETFSVLEVEDDGEHVITVTVRNTEEISVMQGVRDLCFVLSMASSLEFDREREGEDSMNTLSAVYDCRVPSGRYGE